MCIKLIIVYTHNVNILDAFSILFSNCSARVCVYYTQFRVFVYFLQSYTHVFMYKMQSVFKFRIACMLKTYKNIYYS